jgi:hypothetical protein
MFSHRGRVWQCWGPERAQTGAYPWNSAAKCAVVVVAKAVGRELSRSHRHEQGDDQPCQRDAGDQSEYALHLVDFEIYGPRDV